MKRFQYIFHKTAILLPLLLFFSCTKEAHFSVQNKIKGVTIADIKWGNYKINEELEPGETSLKVKVKDDKKEFPIGYNLEFSMRTKGESKYLRTDKKYKLDINQTLTIKIEDDTKISEVIEDIEIIGN